MVPQTTFRHALSRTSEADGTVVHARIHAHSMIGRSYSTGTVLHCSVLGMGRLHTASPPPPRKHAFRARERERDAVCAFAKPTDGRSHTAYHERRCESGCAPSVILRDAEAARSVWVAADLAAARRLVLGGCDEPVCSRAVHYETRRNNALWRAHGAAVPPNDLALDLAG